MKSAWTFDSNRRLKVADNYLKKNNHMFPLSIISPQVKDVSVLDKVKTLRTFLIDKEFNSEADLEIWTKSNIRKLFNNIVITDQDREIIPVDYIGKRYNKFYFIELKWSNHMTTLNLVKIAFNQLERYEKQLNDFLKFVNKRKVSIIKILIICSKGYITILKVKE